jgi:trk system potassium uptake protein TrkH
VLRVIWLRIAAGPRAVLPLERGGARIQQAELENAVALAVVMITALLAAWLVFLAHGIAPLAALFETASALGTAGLSAGVAGPDLAPSLAAVLTGLMWLGRVELFAVLILVLPKTWRRQRS